MSWLSGAKTVYGGLPGFARPLFAGAYGAYLRWWRYGSDHEELVEAALERDRWSEDRWRGYQNEILERLLARAATKVPFYREIWAARRRSGDKADWRDLDNWPILKKDAVRTRPRAFLADDVSRWKLLQLNTSGTSGLPLTLWRTREASHLWFSIFEARTRRWYGVNRYTPWAILGGQIVVPARSVRPPFWVWNAPLRQLYMSTLHLEPGFIGDYVGALKRYGIQYLIGYPSSMYWLARIAIDQGLELPQLRVVVSNAEPLLAHQREVISAAFKCPVRNTYGMAEAVSAGSECEEGIMHVWPDVGIVEVVDENGVAVPPLNAGNFVCTGLLNEAMPLVRYEVGDRGALRSEASGCGHRLPVFESIEGRVSDSLVTAQGGRIFSVNPVFYGLPICEAQVIQENLERVTVRVVPDTGFDVNTGKQIQQRLAARLGAGVSVQIERVERVPRGANGKFKPVISKVSS